MHLRFCVPDLDVPTEWQMESILATIHVATGAHAPAYVHCWGGVGRTGTVVACCLVEQGMSPEEAIEHLARLRRHTERARRLSPETASQRGFIEAWAARRRGVRIPSPDADWQEINEDAHLFDGYRHFGDAWATPYHRIRDEWTRSGTLPSDHRDLRGALFLEFRGDRTAYGDDVILSQSDEEGVRAIVPNPDYASTDAARYPRAIIRRVRELAGWTSP